MKPNPIQLAAIWLLLLIARAPASVLYVDLNCANPAPPYTSWSTAATTIQDAVDASTDGDTVLVTNGVYQPAGATIGLPLTTPIIRCPPGWT